MFITFTLVLSALMTLRLMRTEAADEREGRR
jgi:hypothetical protein